MFQRWKSDYVSVAVIEGRAVRSLACILFVVALSSTVPGCALFNKKTDASAPASGGGTPPAKFPTNSDPLLNGGHAAKGYGSAVLAGRVIDNFSKPPANTSIRLVSMEGQENGQPKDVDVSADGFFTIQGLKTGVNYKLVAQGKNGDHVLGGITYTRAPNLTVVIQVKEDFVNSATADGSANTTLPTTGVNRSQAVSEFQMPAVSVPIPGRDASAPVPVNQDWAPGSAFAADKGGTWPPPLDIPNPTPRPAPPPLSIPKSPSGPLPGTFEPNSFPGDNRLDGSARVPSCVLLGNKLANFALNDVNGNPWEFKTNRQGKLVLIDFWSTTCVPCQKTIPALKQLQSKYGSQGLEVIGVAMEGGGNPQEQAYKINTYAQALQINYRQLVSSSSSCPVRTEFKIKYLPTTVLVDQNGMILWRHESSDNLDQLERLIQRRLNTR